MSLHEKIVAEAKAERDAQGYDPRWTDRDGNVTLYRDRPSTRPIQSDRKA